jgi:hypothetical protein
MLVDESMEVEYTQASDVYSLALVLAEVTGMCQLVLPFDAKPYRSYFSKCFIKIVTSWAFKNGVKF